MSCEGPGALCSNLQKACIKQLRSKEASLSGTLDSYHGIHHATKKEQDYQIRLAAINADLSGAMQKLAMRQRKPMTEGKASTALGWEGFQAPEDIYDAVREAWQCTA
jgi:ABC-type Fe3+-citrate transport system substrate-binding protein